MNTFTIKDLENISGIKAHTIRIWEQRYHFLKPGRTDTNIRYYSNEDLKKVLNISLLNRYGYKISHIDKMNDEVLNEKILSLSQVEAQQERIINELIQTTIDMDVKRHEELLGNYILARGIERTITQIIFPFLEKIGILWSTNHINPAQEHLVSNIIRSKLITGIEGIANNYSLNKTVLLFLPEGEHHEIGLLFVCFLLKSKGINVIYMGANSPISDVHYVSQVKNVDYIYCHLTCAANNFNLEKFISKVAKLQDHVPLIISGSLSQNYHKTLPEKVILKQSFQDVKAFIAGL